MNLMIKFTIEGQLPALNEVIAAAKQHFGGYSKMKKDATKKVILSSLTIPKIHNSPHFDIVYLCKNKRKDPDNVAVAKKFIFDGLVDGGNMDGDGWKQNITWEESFGVDKVNPRIIVTIT